MTWFKKMKVGSKLILGFTLMIVVTACLGLVGYRSATVINNGLHDIFSQRLPSIDYLIEADRDLQQALVAERSMIFADVKSDTFKGLVADYEENLEQADERWDKYKALAATPEEKAIISRYEQQRAEWKELSRRVVDGRLEDTRQGRSLALDLTLGEAKDKFEEMRGFIDQLTELNLKMADKAEQGAAKTYRSTTGLLLSIFGGALLLGIFLMWAIGRGVTRPLKSVIQGLTGASDQVASASSQVSSASQSLAEGASEQAASIEETSSSLEEMSSMTKKNAENAKEAQSMMKEAGQIVEQANANLNEMVGAIEKITASSSETGKIIKTIDEIAFQTNLLALNAAVEAARAGEAGAGFAVVADEVRNLALRAAEAAKNTSDLIEGTISAVQSGNELTQKTKEAFQANTEIAMKIGGIIDDIAAASQEQSEGIDQVNKAVADMDKVTQQNAGSAEESASSSEELTAQAEQMKGMVDQLVVMVGSSSQRGAGGSKSSALKAHGHDAGSHPPASARHTETGTGRQRALQPVNRQGKEVNPKEVIPFDDDQSFKDF